MSDPSLLVLASLADGEKHGYAMMEDIFAFAGIRLGPGTLYGAITRLEQRGWIQPVKSTDRRQPYRLTVPGKRHLEEQLAKMNAVVSVRLYPAGWRARYGAEFEALLEEVEPGWPQILNVIWGALKMQMTEWGSFRDHPSPPTGGGSPCSGLLSARSRESSSRS